MASKALNGVCQRIRTLAAVHTCRACSDRELLDRFLKVEDEAAFTSLVERHGPMIQALCRRLLRDRHEVDDACQATFLVLVRKARSVRKQESLASWLHGVAYRISMSLRRQHARRVRREQLASKQAASKPAALPGDDELSWRDFRSALDEELQRLPERLRAPLILCYLEGKTRDEAAGQLGATPGALHGLLNRGRRLLRDRLTKRGLTLSGVLFATALGESAARAALAPALVVGSARAALALLRGETLGAGLIGPHILSLVKEASQAMFMTKLKVGASLIVAAAILTGVVGGSLISVGRAQDAAKTQPKTPAAAAQKTESDEEFIRRISKDLRGVEPSPTEIHFFVANKDGNRRQKLIDLFIQERQAKEQAAAQAKSVWVDLVQGINVNVPALGPGVHDMEVGGSSALLWSDVVGHLRASTAHSVLTVTDAACTRCHTPPVHTAYSVRLTTARRLATLQGELVKELGKTAKDKKEVAAITQKYLDQLQEYVKDHPKNDDVADAMHQITLIYRSQGKTVEADAWKAKLLKEHPQSPAAKAAQQTSSAAPEAWMDYFLAAQPLHHNARWTEDLNLYFSNTLPNAPPQWPALHRNVTAQPDPAIFYFFSQFGDQPAPRKEDKKPQEKKH